MCLQVLCDSNRPSTVFQHYHSADEFCVFLGDLLQLHCYWQGSKLNFIINQSKTEKEKYSNKDQSNNIDRFPVLDPIHCCVFSSLLRAN